MKKYVRFKDVKTGRFTLIKAYETDDEYIEIMDNIDPEIWVISFEEEDK